MGLDSGLWVLLGCTLACEIPAGLPWPHSFGGTRSYPNLHKSWDVQLSTASPWCLTPLPSVGRIALLHPSTHDTPQLTGHPLCPSVCGLRGPASPQGMVEDALCWASCPSARGHLLPECRAWEIIYLVSYDFVFPWVNTWEAQLMFCAQLRQLQPSAQLCTPGLLMEISPAMLLPRAKGEIPRKPPQ